MAEKRGFFNRFLTFLNKVFRPGAKRPDTLDSKFSYFLEELDKSDENYADVLHVVELCDSAVSVIAQRIAAIARLKTLDENIAGLEHFNKLTSDDAKKLKDLLDRFVSLLRDKKAIRNQLSGFDRSLAYMKRIEGDAQSAIVEIKEAEENQRIFKQDLAYLESENAELEYDRENLATGQKFIHSFTLILVFVFGGAVLLLGYLYFFRHQDVIFPAIVVLIMMIIISALIYAFRRRVKYELGLNVKKQQRAAEMINKKTVVFAHYTNFLNFEYQKYKVRNSDMLKETVSEYNLYKHLNARLDAIRNIMYQTESEISDFLKTRDLGDVVTTIESFAQTVDVQDKREYYNRLTAERGMVDNKLSQFDTEHEQIWDKLIIYQEVENNPEGIINRIVKSCIDETGKIIERSERQEKARNSVDKE